MFVEKESLLQDVESYRQPIIAAAIKSIKIPSL